LDIVELGDRFENNFMVDFRGICKLWERERVRDGYKWLAIVTNGRLWY
jgi:hypothetical protein